MRVVLCVLRGEQTATEAARRAGVSEQTVHNWKRLFLESGREGLAAQGGGARRSGREAELEAENEELKAALGEAHVALRVWQKGAEYLPPSRTSR
jgi:transposase